MCGSVYKRSVEKLKRTWIGIGFDEEHKREGLRNPILRMSLSQAKTAVWGRLHRLVAKGQGSQMNDSGSNSSSVGLKTHRHVCMCVSKILTGWRNGGERILT